MPGPNPSLEFMISKDKVYKTNLFKNFIKGSAYVLIGLTTIMTPMFAILYLQDHGHHLASALVALGSIVFGCGGLYAFITTNIVEEK